MPVDTEAPAAPPPPEAKEKPPRAKAKETAEVLISSRIDNIARDYQNPKGSTETYDTGAMSTAEFNLFSIGRYRSGFNENAYKPDATDGEKGVKLDGGLQVTTTDGNEVTITALLSEGDTGEGGGGVKKTYKARTEIDDPANPGSKITADVLVDAEEIVQAHMAKNAESIAKNFKDPGQKALVEWHATGTADDPPEIANKAIEQEVNPVNAADMIITDVRDSIQLGINTLQGKAKLNKEERDALAEKEALVMQLNLAINVTEPGFAEFAKLNALLAIDDYIVEDLTELQDQLEPEANKAFQILRGKLINEAKATPEDIKLIQVQGLNALADNKELMAKFMEIKGLDKLLFGHEVSEEEIFNMLGGTEEQRKVMDKLKKSGKVGSGLLAAILLGLVAIPAAAVVGGAYIGINAASGAGRQH